MKREEMSEILKEVAKTFEDQLKPLLERKLLKKKQVEDMIAGCKDGAHILTGILQDKGLIKIEE